MVLLPSPRSSHPTTEGVLDRTGRLPSSITLCINGSQTLFRGPCRILPPTKGSGALACEDAFEGSEQSLPSSIATRAVGKDFEKCMNRAPWEQVAQASQ
jgi:hypothetical protein